MTDSLDALLAALEVALRPYCGTVELQASFGGHCLRIRVDSLESRGPACAVVEAIIARHASPLVFQVFAPLDERVTLSLWSKIDYFEGLRLLDDCLDAIVRHMPLDAPRDINGFAMWHTGHSTSFAFSERAAIEATEADYARARAISGAPQQPSTVRTSTGEWYSHRTWSGDYLLHLPEHERWEAWTLRARELIEPLYDQHYDVSPMFQEWMLAICADALRKATPKFRALPNVTDDFIAIIDQGDVDEHTRLFDLARTLGVERAAAMHPLPPLAKLN